jgi:hypothetical protein
VTTALGDPARTGTWSARDWGAVAVAHRSGGDTGATAVSRHLAGEEATTAAEPSGTAEPRTGPTPGRLAGGRTDLAALAHQELPAEGTDRSAPAASSTAPLRPSAADNGGTSATEHRPRAGEFALPHGEHAVAQGRTGTREPAATHDEGTSGTEPPPGTREFAPTHEAAPEHRTLAPEFAPTRTEDTTPADRRSGTADFSRAGRAPASQQSPVSREFAAAVAEQPALRHLPPDRIAQAIDVYGRERAPEVAIGREAGSAERQEADGYWRDVAEVARVGEAAARPLGDPRYTDPQVREREVAQAMRERAHALAEARHRTVGVTTGDERDMARYLELTGESPALRDELKTWVDSALRDAGGRRSASQEEIAAAWQRLPRAQRHLPLSQLARALATVLDGAVAMRGGGGGIEAEFTEVLRLAPGKGTPRSRREEPIARGNGFQVTVETKDFYHGADGRLFRREEDAEDQTGSATEVTLAIPEFVAGVHRVLPSEDRIDDQAAFTALRRLEERFAELGPDQHYLAVEDVFRPEDGWEVTDIGRGARIERRALGDWQGVHVHYTLGVPVEGLRDFLEHVRDRTWRDESLGYLTRAHLTDGLSFGDELAARYAVWREHREGGLASWALPPEEVAALLTDDPVVAALRGYGALLHDQVATLAHSWVYTGLDKVNAAVLSRNSMSDVLAGMPPEARAFLADNARPAMAAMERRIRARLPEYDREYRLYRSRQAPASLLDVPVGNDQDGPTIRDYARLGLVDGAGLPIRQYDTFHTTDLPSLDVAAGNRPRPLVVMEVRSYGERHVSADRAQAHYGRLKQSAVDAHARVRRPSSAAEGWASLRRQAAPAPGRPAAAAVQHALRALAAAEEGSESRLISGGHAAVIAAALPLLDGPGDAQVDRLSLTAALQRTRYTVSHVGSLDPGRARTAAQALDAAVRALDTGWRAGSTVAAPVRTVPRQSALGDHRALPQRFPAPTSALPPTPHTAPPLPPAPRTAPPPPPGPAHNGRQDPRELAHRLRPNLPPAPSLPPPPPPVADPTRATLRAPGAPVRRDLPNLPPPPRTAPPPPPQGGGPHTSSGLPSAPPPQAPAPAPPLHPLLRYAVDNGLDDLRWDGEPVSDAAVRGVRATLGPDWADHTYHEVGTEIAARLNAALGRYPQPHEAIASRYELRREATLALRGSSAGGIDVSDSALRSALSRLGPAAWILPAPELGRRIAALLAPARSR